MSVAYGKTAKEAALDGQVIRAKNWKRLRINKRFQYKNGKYLGVFAVFFAYNICYLYNRLYINRNCSYTDTVNRI